MKDRGTPRRWGETVWDRTHLTTHLVRRALLGLGIDLEAFGRQYDAERHAVILQRARRRWKRERSV